MRRKVGERAPKPKYEISFRVGEYLVELRAGLRPYRKKFVFTKSSSKRVFVLAAFDWAIGGSVERCTE